MGVLSVFLFIFALLMFNGHGQIIKRENCYASYADNIGSAELAEEYFYYKDGTDSVFVNRENENAEPSEIEFTYFDSTGRLQKTEHKTLEGVLTSSISYSWLSGDSLTATRVDEENGEIWEFRLKLINPKQGTYRSWAADSVIINSVRLNDSLLGWSFIEEYFFDSLGNITRQINHEIPGNYVDTNVYINEYQNDLLVKYTRVSDGVSQFYFCNYSDVTAALKKRKPVFSKSEYEFIYNIKGQRVEYFDNGINAARRTWMTVVR